jgi:outer membrane protein assembly factor BamB
MRTRVGLLLFVAALGVHAADFSDPAPPVLEKIPDVPVPEAKPCDDVKFYAKPKPLPAGAVTHDWVSFLGPTHNAVSTETKLLKKFPEGGPTLLWELKRGTGYASPAIQGERLVYLHRSGAEEVVECLRPEDGARYWRFAYPTTYADRYGYNDGPRASPVIDGDRVYVFGAEAKLHCLKLTTGQVIWKRDLLDEFKIKPNFFGVGSTPLIEDNLLIINVGAKGGPGVVGFDKLNGKALWGADDQWGPSYASPIPAEIHGQRRVFVFAGGESRPATGGLLCIDPKTGKLDFRYAWRSKSFESVNASSPVVIGNQVWISATYDTGGTLLTVKPDFTHEVAWSTPDFGTHWNTSVHKDGYLYGFDGRHMQNSNLVCFEVKTGKEMWRKRLEWDDSVVAANGQKRPMRTALFRASLLEVDGQFLCLGEVGHLCWLDLTPQGCTEGARTWLYAADEAWSLPVLSRGLLYVNQNKPDTFHGTGHRLLCYDLRAAE